MYGAAIEGLPVANFALPGPLRDRLVAAVLSGEKTATCGLMVEYGTGEALPQVGGRSVVLDSAERPVCVIETTEVRVLRLGEVDEQFARDEGEGFASVAEWRAAHEAFWQGADMREALGSPVEIHDETLVVAERFRLVERLS
jgi:uncharacterized protein YhfF